MATATRSVKKNRGVVEKAPPLLDLPTEAAFLSVAQTFLAELRDSRERLDAHQNKDDAALHDFRVALRRLRSTIRVYRPVVGRGAIPRKARRSLKRFARITAQARDAEVGLAWLRGTCEQASDVEKVACQVMIADWEARRDAAYKNVRQRLKKKFAAAHRRVDKAFKSRGTDASSRSLAQAAGKLLNRQIAALSSDLGAIHSVSDTRNIHKARIEAKRLRYLLEPWVAEVPRANALIDSLKQFQDRFGELNDRQVLSEELITLGERHKADGLVRELRATLGFDATPAPRDQDLPSGLLALARRLRAERDERFSEIEREYLGERLEGFLDPFRTVAEETGRSRQTPGATAGAMAERPAAN